MKIDRLISMIMLLLERKTVSATELAKTFGVSKRTVYRDLDTINQAGIPIVSHMGVNGGVSIMEQYKVDKRLFTPPEIASLLIGLGGVRSVMSGDEITNTLAKVKGMIPEEKLLEIEFQSRQIAIDLTPWTKDARLNAYLSLIKKAMNEQRTLVLEYMDAGGKTSKREVEPYRLLHKGSDWYLQGYCMLRQAFRTFRFYRIISVRLTDRIFTARAFDSSKMEWEINADTSMAAVIIKFDDTIKSSVIGLYGEGVVESCEDGTYLANIMLYDNPVGYNALFMLGEHCECLGPDHVREYIKKKAAAIAALYQET